MYSREALADIFQRILKFEKDVNSIYEECIENIDDEHIINTLHEISKEEDVHIELAKELSKIIDED